MLPMYDAMGNIHGYIKQSDGTIVAGYEYDAFGQTLRESGTMANAAPFRFSTKYTDTETSLVYYGLRYYSPTLGRFINKDPLEEQGGLNLYAFCGNNGINHYDYLGQSWLSKAFKSVAKFVTTYWKPIVGVVAAIVTYGAASGALFAGETATVSTATTAQIAAGELGTMHVVAASGVLADAVGTGAISATTAGVIAGVAGGAAAGAVSQVVATGSTNNLGEAALGGAIFGGLAGGFGNTWNPARVATTAVAGGIVSEINGGNFSDGALIAGGIATVTYGALELRNYEIAHSPPEALGKSSVGFAGDNTGLAGARPVLTGIDVNGNPVLRYPGSLLGGDQGRAGEIFGMPYGRGDIPDYVNEAFAGVHDGLNHLLNYDSAGYNDIPNSVIGGAINQVSPTAANLTSDVMNWVNVAIATPVVATSVAGVTPVVTPSIISRKSSNSRNKEP